MKLFFSSGVANALLSPTVQHFSNFAQQYQFPLQGLQNEPVVNQPVMNQTMMNQSGVNQPVVNQPVVNQSGVNQPMIHQPMIYQPMINQPMMNQLGVNQPVMNQPGTNQLSVNQPGMNHLGVNQLIEPVLNQSANLPVSSYHTVEDASQLDTSATSVELDTSAGKIFVSYYISTICNSAQCLPPHHYQLPFKVTDQGTW